MCCRFREKLLLVLHLICNIFGLSGSEEKVARREIALWCEENQWRTDRLTIANNMFTLKKKERKKKWSLLSHIVQENKLAIGHLVLTGVLQQVHNITLGFTVLKRYFWGERVELFNFLYNYKKKKMFCGPDNKVHTDAECSQVSKPRRRCLCCTAHWGVGRLEKYVYVKLTLPLPIWKFNS